MGLKDLIVIGEMKPVMSGKAFNAIATVTYD